MSYATISLFGGVDPARRREACGRDAGNVCRFVIDRTDSVGTAKAAQWLTGTPLRIVLVVVVSWIVNRLVRRGIKRFVGKIEGSARDGRLARLRNRTPSVLLNTGEVNLRSAARAKTIGDVLRSVCTAIIWTFAFFYVISLLGFSLGPLLAGAGVAGVALGFGAQSLVRDFLSGFFMLIEDQFGVGDIIDVGDATGTVEEVTLRVTRLRDQSGTVWHVPNGQILRVANKSQQWARAIVDVAVSPQADLEHAARVVEEAADRVWDLEQAGPDVLDRPEVLGLEYLGPDAATIRVQGRTRPGAQWRVSRLLRVTIADALGAAGIELPPANYIRQPPGR